MNIFLKLKTTLVLGICSFAFSPDFVDARVGEEKSKVEIRLFRSGGLAIKEEKLIRNKQRGSPFNKFEDYFPSSTETRIYFKTHDGRRPKPTELVNSIPEGWILQVVYYKSISVIEFYQKTGGIDDFEKNHLLDFQRGDSFWVKKDQESQIEKIGCFSFDYIREDGKTKAKTTHHSILFFSTDFDQALSRAREEELRERAPQSIKGF